MLIKDARATMPAQDIGRARKFYEEKLGLKPGEERPDGSVIYQTGSTNLLVFPSMGKPSGDHTQAGLEVGDLTGAVTELKAKGVAFEEYDFPNFKTKGGIVDLDDSRTAWLKDSEGNLIALIERKQAT
jgi:catechol 2,3-dioxygenase-like lactoylglutathione lyase family enzyme